MTTSYNVKVDLVAVQDAVGLFDYMGGNIKDALRIAINKSTPKIKTVASVAIRSQVRLRASYVGQNLRIKKATRGLLTGAVFVPTTGLPLVNYSTDASLLNPKISWIKAPVPPKNGVRVKVKPNGPTEAAPSYENNKPFYIVRKSTRQIAIVARITREKSPLKFFYAPSLSQVFSGVRDDVMPQASAELQSQLIDAMRYVLLKKLPPEALP